MGPLEKLKAFGISIKDLPLAASGAAELYGEDWGKHQSVYDSAAEDLLNYYGERSPRYNYAKGYFGGLDYGLRTDRSLKEAEKLARMHQLNQAKFRDPMQDLLDLEANLKGLREGFKNRGKLRPTSGPIYDSENYYELLERAKRATEK